MISEMVMLRAPILIRNTSMANKGMAANITNSKNWYVLDSPINFSCLLLKFNFLKWVFDV